MNKILLFILLTSMLVFTGFFIQENKNIPSGPTSTTKESPSLQENNIETSTIPESKVLDLSNQGLTSIPTYVFSKTNVEELNVSNNSLTGAIQAEIRHLSGLRVLNTSNNLMTGVPAEIGQLQQLEVLNLANNKLTGLPYELGNLKNLKVLNLSGNNYSKQDLDIIKKTLPGDVNIIVD